MNGLAQQRCYNHALREAAARCPSCKRFFCRECVTEHSDRLMCAGCIAREVKAAAGGRGSWRLFVALGQAVVGLAVTWLLFFLIGQTLLEVPTKFHEGTLWQENWWDSP